MTFKILNNEDSPVIIIVTPPVEFNMRDRLLLFLCYHEKTGTARVHDWQNGQKLVRIGAKEGYRQNKTETHKNSLLLSTISAIIQFSSVQSLSRVWLFATPWFAACPISLSITNSQSSLNSHPSNWWCHPAISSSVIPFPSCPQSLPRISLFQWVNSWHEVGKALEFQL